MFKFLDHKYYCHENGNFSAKLVCTISN